jgi:hypothetical protein
MAVLTAGKLGSCFNAFARAVQGKSAYALAEQFDGLTKACVVSSCSEAGYRGFSNSAADFALSGGCGGDEGAGGAKPELRASGALELIETASHFLIKGFTSTADPDHPFCIRFEKRDTNELDDFHLASEQAVAALKRGDEDEKAMEGRLFFRIEPGDVYHGGGQTKRVVTLLDKGCVQGAERSGDQYSDYRLRHFADQAMIFVYHFMYAVSEDSAADAGEAGRNGRGSPVKPRPAGRRKGRPTAPPLSSVPSEPVAIKPRRGGRGSLALLAEVPGGRAAEAGRFRVHVALDQAAAVRGQGHVSRPRRRKVVGGR